MWLPLIGKVIFGAIAAAWLGVAGFVLLWGLDMLVVGGWETTEVTGWGTELSCVGKVCDQERYAEVAFTDGGGETVETRVLGDFEVGDEVDILYGPITNRADTSVDRPRMLLVLGAAMVAFAVWIPWWTRRRARTSAKAPGPGSGGTEDTPIE